MARKYQLHGAFPSKAGESAYEAAKKNGFVGTEQEWLASLVGPQGPTGIGESAYEVAKKNGFEGTEQEWLNSLVGPQGPMGPEGATGATFRFELTLEQDVSNVTLTLPVNWDQVLLYNIHMTTNNFTADMEWTGVMGASYAHRDALKSGLKGFNIFGMFYQQIGDSAVFSEGMTTAYNDSSMARPTWGNVTRIGRYGNTFQLQSRTEGAVFPAGTIFQVWGVYAP